WPPPGRSSMLKIACGSYIDDIRGNTTFVANCLYFLENSIIVNSLKFCFEGGGLCFSSPQKKFIKIGHRTRKIRSFLQTSPIICGSYIDDIRGNTTSVANFLYFLENSIIFNSLKFCFEGGGLCFSSPPKKFH